MSQENTEIKKVTLKDFVDDHQKMIAVIGVFVALGLLWKILDKEDNVPFITYLCFFVTIPMFLEIAINWYRIEGTLMLRFFIELFIGIFLLSIGYLIGNFLKHFNLLLAYTIPVVIYLLIVNLFRHTKTFIIYVLRTRIRRKGIKHGLSPEQVEQSVTKETPYIEKWATIGDVVSVIVVVVIFFSWMVNGKEIREFLIPTAEIIFEQPLENNVEPVTK